MKIFNKSRIAWTISALFLVAVTSCSKDEPIEQSPSPSAGQILFTSEQAGLTVKSALIPNNSDFVADAGSTLKTTLYDNVTWWTKTDDRTGIYSTEAYTAPSNSGTKGIVNDEYIADNTAASTSFTATIPMYWGGGTGTPHNFYAYYPYKAGGSAAASVPVGVLSTQSQLVANDYTHIGALDFLVATPIIVNAPDNTTATSHPMVHLVYNHLFTILEFNIAGTGTIGGIRLTGTDLALSGALIDIKLATPLAGIPYTLANSGSKASAVIVNLATAATLTATATDTKVYMVIYPGYAGPCTIEFLNGGIWKNLVSKQAPAAGFLRGQKYVVTVNADATPVSWSTTVWPIIQNKCTTCHTETGGSGGINMGTYAQVAALSTAQIDNARMYLKDGVTAPEQAIIQSWIAGGKLNN